MSDEPRRRRSLSPDDRRLLGASLGVLAAVFALVSSNVAANHSPKPHDLPIGIVGTPVVTNAAEADLGRAAPGAFKVQAYESLSAAKTAVLHRSVYGAFQPIPSPVLLTASAASPAVAALLQRTFATVAARSGQPMAVRDLVPLPESDSSGATTFSAILSLIIVGLAGTTMVYTLTRHRPEAFRLVVTAALGVGAGLITALVTNVLVGAVPDHFVAVWGCVRAVRPRDRDVHCCISSDLRNTRNGDRRCPVSGNRQPRLGREFGPRASPGLLANGQPSLATWRRRHLDARRRLLPRPRLHARPDRSCPLRHSGRRGGDGRVQLARSTRSGHRGYLPDTFGGIACLRAS